MGDQDDWKNCFQNRKRREDDCWKDLSIELLELIVQRLESLKDVVKFAVVCKSWKSAASVLEKDKTWLPSKHHPWLLLAEETGFDLSAVKASTTFDTFDKVRSKALYHIDESKTKSIRGLFSLAKQKVYNLDLPEATNKYIVGTSNGWLVTYGRDFVINLLHPLSRQQIQLPRIRRFYPPDYDLYKQAYYMHVKKLVMSSEVTTKTALQHQDTSPTMMAIYTVYAILGFAKLGDESWTDILYLDFDAYDFHDIIYHREKFYAINIHGTVYMVDPDDNNVDDNRDMSKITTRFPIMKDGYGDSYDGFTYYLIESSSRSHIWVVLRLRKGNFFEKDPIILGDFWFYTSDFKIFKLEAHYHDDVIPPYTSYTWSEEVKNLGNEALFLGRSSSISVASSEFIQPNSIYFTDDSILISNVGGGHDMGIYNVETGKIQPHFQETSVHPFSPPLWYISK